MGGCGCGLKCRRMSVAQIHEWNRIVLQHTRSVYWSIFLCIYLLMSERHERVVGKEEHRRRNEKGNEWEKWIQRKGVRERESCRLRGGVVRVRLWLKPWESGGAEGGELPLGGFTLQNGFLWRGLCVWFELWGVCVILGRGESSTLSFPHYQQPAESWQAETGGL